MKSMDGMSWESIGTMWLAAVLPGIHIVASSPYFRSAPPAVHASRILPIWLTGMMSSWTPA